MQLFDVYHTLSVLAIAALFCALFFPLRKKSLRAKKIALCVVMGLNLFQHFFKFWVWPHMWGEGFGVKNTAYNVCAFLILLCPAALFTKNRLLKQFQFYVGTCAGLFAPIFPVQYLGQTMLQWEYLRFWSCHTLLFLSSFLPGVWDMVPFRMRDGWKFGFLFLGMLCIIFLNNAAFVAAFEWTGADAYYGALRRYNAVWLMGPPAKDNFLKDILVALSFPPFRGGEGRVYTPILWYALPVYAIITAAGYALGALAEWIQTKLKRGKNACTDSKNF